MAGLRLWRGRGSTRHRNRESILSSLRTDATSVGTSVHIAGLGQHLVFPFSSTSPAVGALGRRAGFASHITLSF
jgi:hypothetical protein